MLFPDLQLSLQRLHARCFERWRFAYRELSAGELDDESSLGWELTVADGVTVHYLLGVDAPYGTPTIRLVAPAQARSLWQHVELDGTVCLLPPGQSSMPLLHETALDHLFNALSHVVQVNAGGTQAADPVTQRHRWVGPGTRIWSLLDPESTETPAVAARLYAEQWVVASTRAQLDAWLAHRGWPAEQFADARVVHVPEFTAVPKDVASLSAPDRLVVERGGVVVYVVPSAAGPLLVAVRLQAPDALARLRVDRADRQWLHYRGGDPLDTRVAQAHVAIVGAGSLGSGVADLLARAGVGRLTIIDPDHLSWDNVARHSLGGMAVGRSKSVELVRQIARHLPTTPEVVGLPQTWQQVAAQSPALLRADLIVSTIAAWPDELALSEWARSSGVPLVAGWLEPRAAAGHAVSLQGKCLACQFSPGGQFFREVAKWENGSPIRLADGCHEQFLPYGQAEIVATHGLIARLALEVLRGESREATHRVVVPSIQALQSLGAQPSGYTSYAYEPRPRSVARAEYWQDWPVNPHCWHCAAST